MFFAFLHEMGHLLAGVLLGLKPKSLQIMPFGLSVSFELYRKKKSPNTYQFKKILIAMAGPITNFLIVVAILMYQDYFSYEMLNKLIYSNLIIGIFNLIPIYPLDGGRIVKCLIKIRQGAEKADKKSYQISNAIIIMLTVVSSIAIFYFKNIAILFIIAYLWVLVVKENRKYALKERVYHIIKQEEKRKVVC